MPWSKRNVSFIHSCMAKYSLNPCVNNVWKNILPKRNFELYWINFIVLGSCQLLLYFCYAWPQPSPESPRPRPVFVQKAILSASRQTIPNLICQMRLRPLSVLELTSKIFPKLMIRTSVWRWMHSLLFVGRIQDLSLIKRELMRYSDTIPARHIHIIIMNKITKTFSRIITLFNKS